MDYLLSPFQLSMLEDVVAAQLNHVPRWARAQWPHRPRGPRPGYINKWNLFWQKYYWLYREQYLDCDDKAQHFCAIHDLCMGWRAYKRHGDYWVGPDNLCNICNTKYSRVTGCECRAGCEPHNDRGFSYAASHTVKKEEPMPGLSCDVCAAHGWDESECPLDD